MGINFPTAPAIGTLWPDPAVSGVPQYTWDGEKWTSGIANTVGTVRYDIIQELTGSQKSLARYNIQTGIINEALPTLTDFNTIQSTGTYYTNFPDSTNVPLPNNYWHLEVFGPTGSGYIVQRATIYYGNPLGQSLTWVRRLVNSVWSAWTLTLTTEAQTLTATEQTQVRTNVYAAPLDAMAYSGMQINGGMEVSQEFGSVGANLVASGTFRPCDGWMTIVIQASGAFNVMTARAAIPGNQPGYEYGVVTALASGSFTAATSGDRISLRQTIEGYRMSRLGWGYASASPISYGFRFFSTVAGTIFVRLSNSAADRSYYKEHVVAAGWQWVSGTIPGDTTGTWLKDSGVGMQFEIYLGGADTTPAVPGSWVAGGVKQKTTNSTNLMNAVSNTAYVTGVIIVPGIEAPSAERSPLIIRPYDQELVTCQRYYQKGKQRYDTYMTVSNNFMRSTLFPVVMRASPTISFSNTSYASASGIGSTTPLNERTMTIYATASGTGIVNYTTDWTADARL